MLFLLQMKMKFIGSLRHIFHRLVKFRVLRSSLGDCNYSSVFYPEPNLLDIRWDTQLLFTVSRCGWETYCPCHWMLVGPAQGR